MKITRRIVIIGNALAILGLIAFLIASKLSIEAGLKCSMVENLHIYCPGCGGTRSVYALLHLDIISSIRYNIVVPFGIFVFLFYDIRAIISVVKKEENFFEKQKFILVYVFIGILLINFVVRNILLWGFGIDLIGDFLS